MAGHMPELRAFTPRSNGRGQKPSYTEIGAVWRTNNGNLRLQLDALPVNGTVILIPPKAPEPTEEETAETA